MKAPHIVAIAGTAACLTLGACTVHQTEAPGVIGPSDLALSMRMQATPDSIGQDGGSQSSVKVFANGPDGKPISGLPFRVDMAVDSPRGLVVQDFGALSARSIVTGADGTASVVYTAPPAPPNESSGTCLGRPGTCVVIVATPTSTNFGTVPSQQVTIRLVPLGVILPPAETPTPAFTITPTPVNFNVPATFDASTSCGGTVVGGACSGSSSITSYSWNFGDGGTAAGKVVNHTFTSGTLSTTTFNVTLTIINDRGLAASTAQSVSVVASPVPTGDFVFSPSTPQVNQVVVFNADSIRAAPGHTIVQYSWIFGDGATASGFLASHAFAAPGIYNVTLTVADEVGQKLTISHSVTVAPGTTGVPQANFTFSPASPVSVGTTVTFDGKASTAPNGATIVSYQWNFGDGSGTVNTSSSTATHAYAAAGTFTVSLTVIDSTGRSSAAATRPIQVQ